MHRNRSVDTHRFAMVPRADIPRSKFRIQHSHKTTFDAGLLIPVYVDEVLPGDTFSLKMTAFARLATPLFPLMDNLYLDSFFFFVPNRLVYDNWVKLMGEQKNPGDSISFTVPQVEVPSGGYPQESIYDYFGLPTDNIGAGATMTFSALPLRAYNLIFNEWFRDENLQNSLSVPTDDGPDADSLYSVVRRGKRHDYFTSCLPWPQKGSPVSLPLGSVAPVVPSSSPVPTFTAGGSTNAPLYAATPGGLNPDVRFASTTPVGDFNLQWFNSGLVADLSAATAATINQLRQSFQVQKLLERDARGGTRYTEIIRSHFGVQSPDARLQRPEYLGGGSVPIVINPIAQTSATTVTGGDTPLGNLAAMGTSLAHGHGFSQSFVEHGVVIGLVEVRADLTYQQGVRKMWFRKTRYDFYFPVFSHLGEQAVLNKEIFVSNSDTDNEAVFGYQERWAEYRYHPSRVSSLFRSSAVGSLDAWHLAQEFSALPVLGSDFIQDTPPVERVVAVGEAANGQQFICDMFFDCVAARPLPLYSVPGLIDHF